VDEGMKILGEGMMEEGEKMARNRGKAAKMMADGQRGQDRNRATMITLTFK